VVGTTAVVITAVGCSLGTDLSGFSAGSDDVGGDASRQDGAGDDARPGDGNRPASNAR
jgi:hypothetical protein